MSYESHPKAVPFSDLSGTWNSLRQSVLSNANLARVGQDLGLGPLIHCYAGTIVSLNMLATSVEAIVGAVHMDAGDEAVDRIMLAFGLSSNMLPQVTLKLSLMFFSFSYKSKPMLLT